MPVRWRTRTCAATARTIPSTRQSSIGLRSMAMRTTIPLTAARRVRRADSHFRRQVRLRRRIFRVRSKRSRRSMTAQRMFLPGWSALHRGRLSRVTWSISRRIQRRSIVRTSTATAQRGHPRAARSRRTGSNTRGLRLAVRMRETIISVPPHAVSVRSRRLR